MLGSQAPYQLVEAPSLRKLAAADRALRAMNPQPSTAKAGAPSHRIVTLFLKSRQVQGLASPTSSHGVASFVGQRHNTMHWPPAILMNLPRYKGLPAERERFQTEKSHVQQKTQTALIDKSAPVC